MKNNFLNMEPDIFSFALYGPVRGSVLGKETRGQTGLCVEAASSRPAPSFPVGLRTAPP